MKAKRRIAWLLSFLMVFSLIMGTSKMQVFAAGGEGETATFVIRESNGQTGTVQYKLDGSGDFISANNSTVVALNGATSITIKAIPNEGAQVNQSNSGITGMEQEVFFDYAELISESGWTYNIRDNDGNITFTIEFDNNDGTGGGSNPGENAASYSVDFGEGSWIVGDVTVTADKSGEQILSEGDIITLTGFDAETMEARVEDEDGFGTTLTVTDGRTSISAHPNDVGVPTDITFSVLAKPSGGGGGDNPQQPGPSIGFFAEGGTLAVNNGIFTFSNDTSVLGTVRVTLIDALNNETAYNGNDEVIPLNNVSSVKIVMTPAEDMKAKLITGGDTPVGALSEPVFNDAGNTYTYTAYPSQFGGEQQFLAVNVWFGESEDEFNQVDFTAVIWDGDQVENKSEHGSITVSSVEIGSTTYTYKGNGSFENNNTETDLIEWYGYNKTSINEEAGVRIMDAAFDDPNTEVYINFVFKPDYGYQVTGIGTNESTTSLASFGFSASETISTFRFKVIQHNNPHFAVAFTATEDIVKANAASISEGGVELADNELDGGSAVLEVNEANITNQGDFEAAAEGLVVSEYLDISLYNVFYKGNAEDVWSTPVENLDNPAEITLRLEDGIDTDTVKIVHEKGDGEFELLDADYDPETQEITFSTSSFSNYAIAYTVDNEEFETERYTLTDDKGNVISLTYEKNRELSFTMIDYLAFSPEELETMGIPQELYDSMMEGIVNATKQHGTLLSFYEILVENDDGFSIHEGPFSIKIKMTDDMKKYDIFKIVYMDVEDNFATESPITLTQEGGYLVGTLEHLSTYALVGENTPDPGTTPNTGTSDAHQHSYVKTITKATAKKDGSIVEKCACGDVKSSVVIKKASKIKLSKSSYVYTGKVIKAKNLPKVIVKDSAGKTIAKSNYTIVKPKNIKKMKALGKYAYTIKFKGDKYKGSVKVYLEITPAKVTAKAPKAAKKAVTVTWKKGKKAQVTGYEVIVATNKAFTKNVKTKKIKGYSKTSYKMTKLKAKTKYYVKIRAYKVTKTGTVYGPWSVVKNAKTK